MAVRLSRVRLGWPRHSWVLLFGVSLALYFSYHAVSGSRGLLTWRELGQDLEAARHDLARIRADRQALEHRVERLRPGSLDPDLLDELVRRQLSFAAPDDVIILLAPEGAAPH
jgi:cell division protein FtsB